MARDRSVRVELTRADYARRGVVAVLLVVLVLVLLAARSKGVIGGPDQVSADLANAGGSLTKGADVKLHGVIIGKVDALTRAPDGGVRVVLDMDDGELGHVPANVVARILPATVFGTSFVDLTTHGPPSSSSLRAGAVVPADRTRKTLELQQALDDIDALVKALRPAQLSATLSAAAQALDGRGAELGRMIDGLDAFLRKLGPELPLLRSDTAGLAANLRLVRRIAPDVLDALGDSLVTMRTVVEQKAALTRLLTGGDRLTRRVERFLARNGPKLAALLDHAAVVTDIYHDLRHPAFHDSFATIRAVRKKIGTTIHHGWLDNTVVIQSGVPKYYTPADCPRFGSARGNNCPGGAR